MRRAARHTGVTLIEMMVVLLVIALLAGALTIGYGRLPSTALRREAVSIAAALRAAYDAAAASGAYHRIELDLDAGTYRVERCEGKLEVRRAKDLKEELDRQKDEAEKAAQLAESAQNAAKSAPIGGAPAMTPEQLLLGIQATANPAIGGAGGQSGARCTPVRGELGKPQKLGGHPKVGFNRVWVAHLEDPAQHGKVTITFFPLGTAEKALIELATDPDNVFSIGLQPISGRIEMQQGQLKRPEDFMGTDATGQRTGS